MPVIYNFSAEAIQSYIFQSSELKDMVAASEQLEQLCGPLLDEVLQVLGISPKPEDFLRKAGSAFIVALPNSETAKRLRDLWSFLLRRRFPGLQFSQYIQERTHIIEALDPPKTPPVHSVFCPPLPIPGPLVARSPRLGEAAVEERELEDNEGTERLDAGTKQKRDFLKKTGDNSLLEGKFYLSTGDERKISWPRQLEKRRGEQVEDRYLFPLLGESRYVGVIHADGNGFGKMMEQVKAELRALPNAKAAQVYRAVSDSIGEITCRAARKASRDVLTKDITIGDYIVMPARPLILGGEDLSIIVRADLAIPFTQAYLEEFEQAAKVTLSRLKQDYAQLSLPHTLTACAGIAFVKASQPFHQAHNLAESLCGYAKRMSREHHDKDGNIPASLAFHRITTSMIDNYGDIQKRELRCSESGWYTAMQPYAVGKVGHTGKLPELDDLAVLRDHLGNEAISRGALRELMNLFHLNEFQAKKGFLRWQEIMRKSDHQDLLDKVRDTFLDLVHEPESEDFWVLDSHRKATPLGDVLAWLAVAGEAEHD